MVIVKEREFQLSLRRVLIVVGRVLIVVDQAAGISLHPLAFWPDQRGEKSPLPWLSAIARRGAIAEVARGNAGAAALIGPSSFMIRFTILRAGRPVKMLVRAVWRAASLFRAAR